MFFKINFQRFFLNFGILFLSLISFFSIFNTLPVQAQTINDLNILGVTCLVPGQPRCSGKPLSETILELALNVAPVLAVLVIMYGGYKYFFNALDIDASDGKKTIQAGVIGLVIVLVARSAVWVIQNGITGSDGGLAFNTKLFIDWLSIFSNFLFLIAGAVATLVMIWGGYKYYFSALPGDQKDGMQNIQRGVTGLLAVLFAAPISNLITSTVAPQTGDNPKFELKPEAILGFIRVIISQFAIPLSSVITVLFLILAGYYFLTAAGDSSKEKAGQTALRNAIIGLVVILLSTTIVQLIIRFVPVSS